MKVNLITYTPESEKIIAAAAKLCYSSSDIDNLINGLTEESSKKFVEKLSTMGHESPIEHVSFTFGIEGVSRSFLAQMTRHRIASFSVQSQRYVKNNDFKFITPPEIANNDQAKKIYIDFMQNSIDTYNEIADILQEKHYKYFIEKGFTEKAAKSRAEKKAIEDARFVLPNASETKMVVTMNARTLLHFFNVRCCNRAQWEIRDVANEMLRLCYKVAPTIFNNAGPSCIKGECPEGEMSCGEIKNVRKFYEDLKYDEQG